MKNLILFFSILLCSTAAYSQQYHMTGRFSNTTPNVNSGLDSAIFVFTPTHYQYFINANTAPSSQGTYWVSPGGNTDTLYLVEDSLGVCSQTGTGITVWFNLDYTVSPYYSLIITESDNSMIDCPSHSNKIEGDYLGWDGMIFPYPASVVRVPAASAIQAHVYNSQLSVASTYNEKVTVTITNISGQKMLNTREALLLNGNQARFDLTGLIPGMYFAIIQSEHERKAIKFAL